MDKDGSNCIAEAQSLVDILKKQHRGTAVKLGGPRRSSFQPEAVAAPTQNYENQIKELKLQLEQKDAALAERDSKCKEQAVIIEALVQQMSDMEDEMNSSHAVTTDGLYEDVAELLEEKNQLAKRVEYLESQLEDAMGEAQALRILLNNIRGSGRNFEKTVSKTDDDVFDVSEADIFERDIAQSFPNRSSAKELNVALLLAESEKEDLTKQIQNLQTSLAESKRLATTLRRKCVTLEREMEARGDDHDYNIKENAQAAAMRQRLSRAEAEQRDVERKVLNEKKHLESQLTTALGMIQLLQNKLEETAASDVSDFDKRVHVLSRATTRPSLYQQTMV